jgi:hypothetical protein
VIRLPTLYRHLGLWLLVLLLAALGVAKYSRLTPAQQRTIDLEAGLEYVYYLEQAHYQEYGAYVDPTDPESGLRWPWMNEYRWDVELKPAGFSIVVEADLDGDGDAGAWSIDEKGPQVYTTVED